jgi:metallo-beta-lactamase class B
VKKIVGGFVVALAAAIALQAPVVAQEQGAAGQGRGGQGRGGARAGGAAAPAEFPTKEEFENSKDAQMHVAAAMKIGGKDMADTAKWFCTATGPQRVALARQQAGLPALPVETIGPIKLFDNLTYIGFNSVGAWVVKTSEGLILFDTLNSTDDATKVIEPEMMKAGLDPAQIKYILVGHGHADHFGGAKYLQDKYHARVLGAMPDWAAMQRGGRGAGVPGVTPDMDVTDGQKLTLGDTTLTLIRLPGHTPGTIGMIVPAKFKGQTHNVMVMSGTQMPTQDSLDTFKHVYNDEAKKMNVESFLGSHPDILMNTQMAMEGIRDKYPTGNHPLLLTKDHASRYLDIMLECARARLAAQGRLTSTN